MNPIHIIHVTQEDFPEFMQVCCDMPPDASWENWRQNVAEFVAGVKKQGGSVKEVTVKPAVFAAWCKEQGLEPNGSARSRYAALHD